MSDEIVPISSLDFWAMMYYNRELEIRWAIAEGRMRPRWERDDERED